MRSMMWTIAATALLCAPALDAHAQSLSMGSFRGYLTGHIGTITAGAVDEARATAGASVAVHEATGWGAELDFGHSAGATASGQSIDVTSYMVNAAWVRPVGLIRPFGSGGAGILQIGDCGSPCTRAISTYDFGFSAGAGAFVAPHDAFAFRADVRYFFSAVDHQQRNHLDNFNFWRISIGATYIWAIAP
jgi:opacity protein-like surface antigen